MALRTPTLKRSVRQMRAAVRGLIVAYAMVLLSWLFITQIARHLLPDISEFGFVVLVGGPFIIVQGGIGYLLG